MIFIRNNHNRDSEPKEVEETASEKSNRLKNQLAGFSGQEHQETDRGPVLNFVEYIYKVVDGSHPNRYELIMILRNDKKIFSLPIILDENRQPNFNRVDGNIHCCDISGICFWVYVNRTTV